MTASTTMRIGAEHVEYAVEQQFDLVVVGGGITGAWATAMAAAAGLKVCLVEAGDFGGATSRVSHRILHGGFRYLQSGDIPRLRESVRERREWFRCFPDLVEPLPCLMPLYGQGLKRPWPFRAATLAYRVLAADRNKGVRSDRHLAAGGVVSSARTQELFESVRPDGLQGSGVWHDGVMCSHPRLIMSLLRFAASKGAVCLNHTPALGLDCRSDIDVGLRVRSAEGSEVVLDTVNVLNTASVWASAWDKRLRVNAGSLVPRAMAFNIILDRPPVGTHGVAVQPPQPDADGERRVYFLVPRHGRIAAGTMHLPSEQNADWPRVTWAMVDRMLSDLNAAVPGLHATRDRVLRVDAGLLPADEAGQGETSDRPVVTNHDSCDNVVSAVAVKYTTARQTAALGLNMLLDGSDLCDIGQPRRMAALRKGLADLRSELPRELLLNPRPDVQEILGQRDHLIAFCRAEGVGSMADLLLGRTEWGEDPGHAMILADHLFPVLADVFGWSEETVSRERGTLAHALRGALPTEGETDPLSPG